MHPGIADWTNFFVAEVGAAAALTGLVAVAISINLARILSFPQLPPRAAETLVLLTGIFTLASLALFPGQPEGTFGLEALIIGLVVLAVSANAQARAFSAIASPSAAFKIVRAVVSAAAIGPLIAGGAMIVTGSAGGFYVLAAGVLISLAAGVWNSWILLVEILR